MAAKVQTHEDFSREEEIHGSSDSGFGLVFAGVFAIVTAVSLWRGGRWWPYAIALAVAFAGAALLRPGVLAPLNRLWMRFGLLLAKVVNPLVLGLLFFVTILPIGLIMRALGKDLLRLKLDRSATSYWIAREPPGPPPPSMRNQY
jgi:predicted membrane metal-binding protein